ncbi:hypothetical protein [Leptospira interrogans]|nr:hypothetical protein [Leptospira interrogans]ULG77359.1 hypothetical protein FH597_02625 [Leptospira interrogans]
MVIRLDILFMSSEFSNVRKDFIAVDSVYKLLAKRDLRDLVTAYRLAKEALNKAEDIALLALHEALVFSLEGLLTELGEHGLLNGALFGIDPDQINLRQWLEECIASFKEVKRLRNTGLTSSSLIDPYVGNWMFPIGSRDWLNQMKLVLENCQNTNWIERVTREIHNPSLES